MLLPASLRHEPPIDVQGICVWCTGLVRATQVAARVETRSDLARRPHGYVNLAGQRIYWCRRRVLLDASIYATTTTAHDRYQQAVRTLMADTPSTPLAPKEEYIEAEKGPNNRWRYGFGDLEVGDQLRCPYPPTEQPRAASERVLSAAIGWAKKHQGNERDRIRFRSQVRNRYVLIERIA